MKFKVGDKVKVIGFCEDASFLGDVRLVSSVWSPEQLGPIDDHFYDLGSIRASANELKLLKRGGKKVSLLTKLLKPDQALVQEYYTNDCGKLDFENEDVQKAIYDLIEKDLILSAKDRKAGDKKSQ